MRQDMLIWIAILAICVLFRDKWFIGRLPFDWYYEGKNFSVYTPLGSALVLSLAFSVIRGLVK